MNSSSGIRRSMLVVASIAAMSLPLTTNADWMDFGIQSICEPSANQMIIMPYAFWNVEADHSDQKCIFSTGRRVLARGGLGSARPYGMGGADPAKWLSVWIDGKRVISRQSYNCSGEGVCGLYFIITNDGFEACSFPFEEHALYQRFDLKEKSSHNCIFTPNNKFSSEVDRVEYPEAGDPVPPVAGTIVVEYAADPSFCRKFLADQFNFHRKYDWEPIVPKGGELLTSNPAGLAGETGKRLEYSSYDVDNDGAPEHIYRYSEETNYRDADIFFIFANGRKLPDGTVIEDLAEIVKKSDKVFPQSFQCGNLKMDCKDVNDGYYPLRKWPENSKQHADGFRLRYLRVDPFLYNKKVYFSTRSREEALLNIFTVIRPNMNSSATDMCYFRKVAKHY